jgi:hypothetical protein
MTRDPARQGWILIGRRFDVSLPLAAALHDATDRGSMRPTH